MGNRMTLNNSEFDEVRQDLDVDEPLDGRDGQPVEGSSDEPSALDAEDPLHGAEQIIEENDTAVLATDEATAAEPAEGIDPEQP